MPDALKICWSDQIIVTNIIFALVDVRNRRARKIKSNDLTLFTPDDG